MNRIQRTHTFIRENAGDIFKERNNERSFAEFAKSLRNKSSQELKQYSFSNRWHQCVDSENFDDYSTLSDIFVTKLGDDVKLNEEINLFVECKKYIWDCQVETIAKCLKTIGLDIEEAVKRIQDEYISGSELQVVMARSHDTLHIEMENSMEQFAIAKEEDKRKKFLRELRASY